MEVKQAKQIMNFSHFDIDFLFHDTMGKRDAKRKHANTCRAQLAFDAVSRALFSQLSLASL